MSTKIEQNASPCNVERIRATSGATAQAANNKTTKTMFFFWRIKEEVQTTLQTHHASFITQEWHEVSVELINRLVRQCVSKNDFIAGRMRQRWDALAYVFFQLHHTSYRARSWEIQPSQPSTAMKLTWLTQRLNATQEQMCVATK